MTTADLGLLQAEATRHVQRKKIVALAVPAVILLYLTCIFFAFDMAGLAGRARLDNAAVLLSDAVSYKTRVTRDSGTGEVDIAIEGERNGESPDGMEPDWLTTTGDATVIDLSGGEVMTLLPDNAFTLSVPGYPLTAAALVDGRVTSNQTDDAPDWISQSGTRLGITTPHGRVTLTRSKTEVFHYQPGRELFFFTLDSPYHGHGPLALAFGPQHDPARGNLSGMWQDFWSNRMWRHADVAWAIGETILLAFLGTFGAAIVVLPLAFVAARNFTPLRILRFGVRRVFDFVRGVDALIWTIMLSRAFGPGPLTGALAILVTDTGSFGKIFSEALENADDRQIEGVASTGAATAQRDRFDPGLVADLLALAWWDWPHDRLRAALDDFRTLGAAAFVQRHG